MPERLSRRDGWWIAGLVAVIALSLTVGIRLFPLAFPEATIDFTLDRAASEDRARELLAALDYDVGGYLHAARFEYDAVSKVYLERELGLAAADSSFSRELHLWRWSHRWFRPLQRESYRVEYATSDALAAFARYLEEEAPGNEIDAAAAREIAEEFLEHHAAVRLGDYDLVASDTRVRPRRTDRTFTWERRDRRWAAAPLRVRVVLQGDRIGGLATFLDVPEAWRRDYAGLRSRNEATGIVAALLYGLLLIVVAVAFVRRIPRGGIQWRTALGFATVGVFLLLLGELNSFESSLFSYDTHRDLSSFLVGRMLDLAVRCLAFGLFVFVLTAGSEAVYREAYPEKISLGGFFTRRGLRTRRFFFSLLAGYALTAFFFAYQAVFYLAAGAAGAWAPAEVPYDDLLNTSLPWAVVLLVGFAPAVTEELSARMFAIPWLTRLLRSRVAAVLLAAALWGFAHANYPNQPFYIRGVEVGLVGVLVGVVMLRLNILAVLVWHFTVDAFYAAYLLLRSGNAYYVITGALAAGLLLLPLFYAVGAYLRRGRFRSANGIRNRDLPPAAAPPVRSPPVVRRSRQDPATPRRWGIVFLLIGLFVTLVYGLPLRECAAPSGYRIGAAQARALGRAELREIGAPVESLRIAAWPQQHVSAEAYRYGLQHAEPTVVTGVLDREVGTQGWVVRAFAPLRPEEWRVFLSAGDGRLLGFDHRIGEDAAGASLAHDSAQAIAEAFLHDRGFDLQRWDLKNSRSEPREARRDHEFTWEAADSSRRLGAGAVRTRVIVQGAEIGAWQLSFKLPEAWQSRRSDRTPFDAMRLALLGLLLLGALVWTARRLSRTPQLGPIQWRRGLTVGLIVAAAQLVALAVSWETALRGYETSHPWLLFLIGHLAPASFGSLLGGLALGVGLAMISTVHPHVWDALQRKNRRIFGRDALLGMLAVIGSAVILVRARLLFRSWVPGALPLPDLGPPPGIGSRWAFWPALADLLSVAAVGAVMVGLGLFLLRGRRKERAPGLLLLGLATVALLPESARTAGELGAVWGPLALAIVAALLLARYVLRANVLAYLCAILVVAAAGPLQEMMASPVTRPTALALAGAMLVAIPLFLLRGRNTDPGADRGCAATPGGSEITHPGTDPPLS